jgi:hypothetical protein
MCSLSLKEELKELMAKKKWLTSHLMVLVSEPQRKTSHGLRDRKSLKLKMLRVLKENPQLKRNDLVF